LVECIFDELSKGSERLEEFDKFHYLNLTAFVLELSRLKAYEA
jgi:hypothetical protein